MEVMFMYCKALGSGGSRHSCGEDWGRGIHLALSFCIFQVSALDCRPGQRERVLAFTHFLGNRAEAGRPLPARNRSASSYRTWPPPPPPPHWAMGPEDFTRAPLARMGGGGQHLPVSQNSSGQVSHPSSPHPASQVHWVIAADS